MTFTILPCLVKLQGSLNWLYVHEAGLRSNALYQFTRTNRQNPMKVWWEAFDKSTCTIDKWRETTLWTKKRRQTLHKILRWFAWDFGFHRFNLRSFVICFNVIE